MNKTYDLLWKLIKKMDELYNSSKTPEVRAAIVELWGVAPDQFQQELAAASLDNDFGVSIASLLLLRDCGE